MGFAQGNLLMSNADGESQRERLHIHHRAQHHDESYHRVERQHRLIWLSVMGFLVLDIVIATWFILARF